MTTTLELHTEAKRRVMRANPTITAEGFDAWLTAALSRGASIVLQLDGARAEYPRADAPACQQCALRGARNDHERPPAAESNP